MANVAAIRIEHARLNEIEEAERAMAKEMQQAALIQTGPAAVEAAGSGRLGYRRKDYAPAERSAAIITITLNFPTGASACWWATWRAKACPRRC